MARNAGPLLQYRGTTAQHQSYSGPVGELTVDTDKKVVVVQTGAAGGNPMAPENRQIKAAASSGLTVNNGTGATLASDITLALVPADFVDTANSVLFMNSGKISSKFSLDYNEATGKLTVKGSDDSTEVASVTIPTHTSALQSATIVNQDGSGGSGTFLKMTFLLTSGATSDVYADVSKLVDVYTAGSGININEASNRQISVKLATNSGLAFDAQGALQVDLTGSGSGSTGGVAGGLISSDSTDGDNELKTGSDGKLYVEPYTAGNGLALNDHEFSVVAATNKGLSVSSSGVAVELATDGGIVFDASGKLKVDFTGGAGSDGSIAGGLVADDTPDDSDNDLKVDEDGKLYVEPYTAGDGLALSSNEFSVSLEATGNQLQFKSGKLWVPTDYGTMDA